MGLKLSDLPPGMRQKIAALLTAQEPRQPKRNKFGARKKQIGAQLFDSQREAAHFQALQYRVLAKEIENLQCQPIYYITRDGAVIAKMTLDFRYVDRRTGAWVVVDVKGGRATRTEAYQLRKKLVEAQYGFVIEEVG